MRLTPIRVINKSTPKNSRALITGSPNRPRNTEIELIETPMKNAKKDSGAMGDAKWTRMYGWIDLEGHHTP